jgi:hypothetical protein
MLPSLADASRIFAAKRTRPPPPPPPIAGRALARTLKALNDRFGQGADGLKARWSEIVGAALARRTEPVKLVKPRAGGGAALEIRVEGPSAALVQHQAAEILERVNLFLGPGAATRLRIIQGPLRGPPPLGRPTPGAARRRVKAPLDAAEEQALAQSLEALPEGRLKGALTRLGREVMREAIREAGAKR